MIVYKATFPDDKVYIGRTVNPLEKRIKQHYSLAKRFPKRRLHRALRKFPEKSIDWQVIATATNLKTLDSLERGYIKIFNAFSEKDGYNTSAGHGYITKKKERERIRKISATMKGVPKSSEARKRMSKGKMGIIFSEEHLKNMSKSKIGKKLSPYHIACITEGQRRRRQREKSVR